MFLSSVFVGMVALVVGIEGQSTSISATPTSTSTTSTSTTSAAATHSISVGYSGFQFNPDTITNAFVGDVIEFRFYPTGHSVVRSEYKLPCIPYEDTGENKVGFSSDYVAVNGILNDPPTYRVRVNDTAPIFFYCAAPGSCIDNLMIGVVNPNETQTLDVQRLYAENATQQLAPGDPFPSETGISTAITAITTASSTSTFESIKGGGGGSSNTLNAGAIAGIAIGGAAVLVLTGTLLYLCGRRGGLDKAYNRYSTRQSFPPAMVDASFVPTQRKSPGQATFPMTTYSSTPSNDPYRHASPGHAPQYSLSRSPPPMSLRSQTSYQHLGSPPPHQMGSPMMQAMDGNNNFDGQGYFVPYQAPTAPHMQQPPPVELATSSDPGNSPLHNYNNPSRTFSWSRGGETAYRPSDRS